MAKAEGMLYEDKNGNTITNFKIGNSSKICICKQNNIIIETYQFKLQIDGKEDIIVFLNHDGLIKYMKSSGCVWLPEANVNYFTIERKVKELCSKNKEETPILFEKPGWNLYKNEWYYVCTDCTISASGIDTNKTTIIRNRNFNYIKDVKLNKDEAILDILRLILDNKELFYSGLITTVISLMLDKLNNCNLAQTPIIWLSGETGAGKTTLLRDTFFILENDFGGINLNLSTQPRKTTKENMENNSDCIIAYDDVRKTYSNSSNQRISTTLEEFVRQYSEIIDNRIIFAVTGEANVLAQQGESFQNRCMEFEVNNVVSKYSKVLNDIKQKRLMKVLWEQFIIWMAKMRNEKTFPNLENIYRNWIKEHTVESNSARGIQMAFAEYASGYVFNEFIKNTLNTNQQKKNEWFNFTKKNIENGILYREARHYLPVETFKKYLYQFISERKLSIIKAKYIQYAYDEKKEVDCSRIALPIYNKEHYIGIYFKYGISNIERQTEAKPFLLLDIGHTLESMNYFLNLECNNQLNYFNEKKLYKRLAEKKVLYVCQKSSSSDGFRYAFEYPAYVSSNRQDLRRCWMLVVDKELDNILKDAEEVKDFRFAYKVDDKYLSIIKSFLNDPENEGIEGLNSEEYEYDNDQDTDYGTYYDNDYDDTDYDDSTYDDDSEQDEYSNYDENRPTRRSGFARFLER